MKREPVRIQLVMSDAGGVIATTLIEVEKWIAFKADDRKKMKRFKGIELLEFMVTHSNGAFSWPA